MSLLDEVTSPERISADADEAGRFHETVPAIGERRLDGLFRGSFRPTPLPLAYRLSIAGVAVLVVLLPLVYVALVAGVVYGLYLHATVNLDLLVEDHRLRSYLGPFVVGAILVFFLVKPFFAPRKEDFVPFTLDPERERTLHGFVRRIAREVGAPEPVRIDVDLDVNASASFRRGMASFLGNDLVLTVGAPLIAGMTVEELTSVLAHELGHFRQGLGMRFGLVIRRVNRWFERVVNERDAWDGRLAKGSGWYGSVLGVARFLVWLTRRLLAGLAWVATAVSRYASRQMEFDADTYAVGLVGERAFAASWRKLILLEHPHATVFDSLGDHFRDGALPADLPAFVLSFRSRLQSESAAEMVKRELSRDTNWLATHGALKERIARAEGRGGDPVLLCPQPARALLRDASSLFRKLSADCYRRALGDALERVRLVSTVEFVHEQADRAEAVERRERYTQGAVAYFLLLDVRDAGAPLPADRGGLVGALRGARASLASAGAAAREALERIDQADTRVAHALRARQLLRCDGALDELQTLDVPDGAKAGKWKEGPQVVEHALAKAAATVQGLSRRVEPCHEALARRILATAALLAPEEDAARFGKCVDALRALAPLHDRLQEIRLHSYVAGNLLGELFEAKNTAAEPVLQEATARQRDRLLVLRDDLARIPNPLDDGDDPRTCADALLPEIPPREQDGAVAVVAQEFVQALVDLHFDLLSDIAEIGLRAEEALGIDDEPQSTAL